MTDSSCRFIVALDQCGLELQAPNMVTTTKRQIPIELIETRIPPEGAGDPRAHSALSHDSLRNVAWDPEAVRARYTGLDPSAHYRLEAVYVAPLNERRSQSMSASGVPLHEAVVLTPGRSTTVSVDVPEAAYADGTLEVSVHRVEGPDAVLSELRLFSSVSVPPTVVVVGDSRGGLIGTVSDPAYKSLVGVSVQVQCAGQTVELETDDKGMFTVPLADVLPLGRHAEVVVSAATAEGAAELRVDTRDLARGLRELPPDDDRLDLGGSWAFTPGAADPAGTDWSECATTRVPGHVAFDGLVPDHGVGTLHRDFEVPAEWAGSALFLRFNGAYGRAKVFVNGAAAGVHGGGATSFDLDVSEYVVAGTNSVTVTLTEYTPHSVIDYMSWYAHISLLGLWREVFLFRTEKVHLSHVDLAVDWDVDQGRGSLDVRLDVINLETSDQAFEVAISVEDGGVGMYETSVSGEVGSLSSSRARVRADVPGVESWSAERPRLYDLNITVSTRDGAIQRYHRRVGFRRVEVRGNQLLVNGAAVRMLGVNRHDARMLTGRALTTEDMRTDLLHFRHANVNVIRTAHYPADPRFLDLCDEIGMYVFEESPICIGCGFDDHHWNNCNEDPHVFPFVLEVTAEMVNRDKGHPSVIVWDLANETQWGQGFTASLAMVRSMDPTRPTIFSHDLNMLGDDNPLRFLDPADRPEIRAYHYLGWDRHWLEDVHWLRSYDEPVIVDESMPAFQDNVKGPLHAYALTVDPGMRDYWVVGAAPQYEHVLKDRGLIGAMLWGGVDDMFALPLDHSIGYGPWAHLPIQDYFRTRDLYPGDGTTFFRGEGEWGLLDSWGRPRPELWHLQKMFSPISVAEAHFSDDGGRLELAVRNRFSHLSLGEIEVRLAGARDEGSPSLSAPPGGSDTLSIEVADGATEIVVEFWHREGRLVDAFSWPVPSASADPGAAVLAAAEPLRLSVGGEAGIEVAGSTAWLGGWPTVHVQDANRPDIPVPQVTLGIADTVVHSAVEASVPIKADCWEGSVAVTLDGPRVIFEYHCMYTGDAPFFAREVGLTFEPPAELADLWWDRTADWSYYPAGHIGRARGYAPSAPRPRDPLNPAAAWPQDSCEAGTNDYRSAKRQVRVAGATNGERSLSLLADGSQHVRAEIVDGRPVLHVLDWYGGVSTLEGVSAIWTSSYGPGRRIERGTELSGTVVLVGGDLPEGVERR